MTHLSTECNGGRLDAADRAPRFRAVAVPTRRVGARTVVARPADGAARLLNPTAAQVWELLHEPMTADEVDRHLGTLYPAADEHRRTTDLHRLLDELRSERLVLDDA